MRPPLPFPPVMFALSMKTWLFKMLHFQFNIPIYCKTQPSSIQRLSSSIFPCSFVCPSVRPAWLHLHLSPLDDVLDYTNHTFSGSSWSKDIKTDITKCLMHKYTNTNTQIHKYSIRWSAKRPNMWYIFEKRIVQGY